MYVVDRSIVASVGKCCKFIVALSLFVLGTGTFSVGQGTWRGARLYAAPSSPKRHSQESLSGESSTEITLSQEEWVDISMPVRRLANDAKALAVPATVGGQSTYLHLDTGSSGLRILAEAVDPNRVARTGKLIRSTFADGTVFEGEIAIASVSIGPIATVEPIAIHVVDRVQCPQSNPSCFDTYTQAGMMGVLGLSMGARSGGGSLEVYSPISRLPGGFSSGYIVRTRGFYSVDGRLTIGLTADNLAGFYRVNIPQRSEPPTTFDDGSPIWRDSWVSLDYSLAGDDIPPFLQRLSGNSLLDAGSAHIVLAVDRDPSYSVRLWPGAILTGRHDDTFSWQLQAGNTPSLSQIFVRGMPRSPEHILGLPFFFNYEVAFNRRDGAIGFKPIGTTPSPATP